MIESYVEKDIVRQVKLVEYLFQIQTFPINELANNLQITLPTLKKDIVKVFTSFLSNASYKLKNNFFIITFNEPINKYDVIKKIYQQSQFLRTCSKYIQGKAEYVTIMEEEFLSVSQTFRLKNKIYTYLENLHVLDKQHHVKDEWQWRNFVLSVWPRIGVPEDFIDEDTWNKAHYFIHELENELESLFDEREKYILIVLVYLMLTRSKSHPLIYKELGSLQFIPSSFFYRKSESLLKKCFPDMEFSVHEISYLSIYLRLVTQNHTSYQLILDDFEYTKKRLATQYLDLNLWINELISDFEKEFKIELRKNILFEKPFSDLMFSTLLDIQSYFFAQHYYLTPEQLLFKEKVMAILNRWQNPEITLVFNPTVVNKFCSLTFPLLSKYGKQNYFICIVAEDEFSHILYREKLQKWLNNQNIILSNTLYYSIDEVKDDTKLWDPLIIYDRSLAGENQNKINQFPISRNTVKEDIETILSFLYKNC